jgi:hypothetical protein
LLVLTLKKKDYLLKEAVTFMRHNAIRRSLPKGGRDILLLLIAILIVLVFWKVIGVFAKLALFILAIYLIYRVLQSYI